MENAIRTMETQLTWVEKRLEEEKNSVVRYTELMTNYIESVEHYEKLIQEYQAAIDLLRSSV